MRIYNKDVVVSTFAVGPSTTIPNGSLKGPHGWHPPTGRPGAEAFGEAVDGDAPASYLTVNRQPDGGLLIAHHGSNRATRRHPKRGAARRLHFGR